MVWAEQKLRHNIGGQKVYAVFDITFSNVLKLFLRSKQWLMFDYAE